jgi:hypothetical protein
LVNNLAPFWLLRGDAGAVIVHNCDALATASLHAPLSRLFRELVAAMII